jgi:hypothetical protein
MGKNVIIVHRLLKNNVEGDEYFLMTKEYTDLQDAKDLNSGFNWSELQIGSIIYDHIGEILFRFIPFSDLRKNIPPTHVPQKAVKYSNPIIVSLNIDAPIGLVYNTIINLDIRIEWTYGLKRIKYNKDEIPRIGSRHLCDLPGGLVEIETVEKKIKEEEMEYVERVASRGVLLNATTFFTMKTVNSGTKLTIEFHYQKLKFIGKIIDLYLRKKIISGLTHSITNLKQYCERKSKS